MQKININEIDRLYNYSKEDLGYTFKESTNVFKVWSPLAEEMKLCIYEDYDSEDKTTYNMIKNELGVWEVCLSDDLKGKYYTFLAKIEDKENEAVDPYAKALSVNGEKGAIVYMKETNPENWENHKRPKLESATDAIIYEVHTRDLSIDKHSGIKNKGKFIGFCEEDTSGPEETKTGLAHIKDLGVTHVQLLPIYDFGSVDERKINPDGEYENSREYNWGYDPMNYNAPEGSYATDAYDPISRIKELKSAIKTMHENGLGVIMDVVYNHMYDVERSSFNKLMPGYFFRYDEEGKLCDESGCGNAVASENMMVRKFIVDSVKHWAREYKLDGFRFDLMGLIDAKTMNELKEELHKIDPSIIILGEGWNMGETLKDEEKAIQPNAHKMKDIAFFNDDIRDALRGSCFDDDASGFLNGAEDMELRVKKGIVGGIDYSDDIETWGEVEPNQVVNYIECHDNNTLFDKLKMKIEDEEKLKYMSRLGGSIVLLSQGIPFIHAGQEFLRTKNGVENSYNSNDTINKMDWNRKNSNMDTVEYFKGLINLRKSCNVFRMKSRADIREKIKFIDSPKNSVAYFIDKSKTYNKILVIHNGNESSIEVNLGVEGEWNIVVDKQSSGVEVVRTIEGNKITVQGLETIVAYI